MSSTQVNTKNPHKFLWFIVCIGILALGLAGFTLLKALKPAPEQRPQSTLRPRVETIPLEYRNAALLVRGSGFVSPKAEIRIAAQVAGEISQTHHNLVTGGSFQKGDTILQIDSRSYVANLAEAQASKRASVSNLNFINKQIERLSSLLEKGYTPEESLDDAISRRDQALANITRLEALIELRQLDLERTVIRAPFTGRILSESVDKGEIVSVGRELAQFYASDEVEIIVSLNANDASFIPGLWNTENTQQRQTLVEVEHAGRTFQWSGYLDRVEADIDPLTRTVDVAIRVPNPSQAGKASSNSTSSVQLEAPPLLIGMYANVAIEGMALAKHFVVPINVIHNDNFIWITNTEGILSIEPVEVVRSEGNMAVVLAPQLSPGVRIITSNIALVSPGMQVLLQANASVINPSASTQQ